MKPNAAVIFFVLAFLGCETAVAPKPNLLLVVVGLGYGDAGCYGAIKVNTPDIDRLARKGMRVTDPHSTFTASRPSRYRLLAGRMAFRSNCPGVSEGVGGPCLINPGQPSRPVASHIQPLIFTGQADGAEAVTGGRKPDASVRVPA